MHLINSLEYIRRKDRLRGGSRAIRFAGRGEYICNNKKTRGFEHLMQIPCSLPANKIPEAMAAGANECLVVHGTSVDHRGVFSSCVNRFYVRRIREMRAEYHSSSIPEVTHTVDDSSRVIPFR